MNIWILEVGNTRTKWAAFRDNDGSTAEPFSVEAMDIPTDPAQAMAIWSAKTESEDVICITGSGIRGRVVLSEYCKRRATILPIIEGSQKLAGVYEWGGVAAEACYLHKTNGSPPLRPTAITNTVARPPPPRRPPTPLR